MAFFVFFWDWLSFCSFCSSNTQTFSLLNRAPAKVLHQPSPLTSNSTITRSRLEALFHSFYHCSLANTAGQHCDNSMAMAFFFVLHFSKPAPFLLNVFFSSSCISIEEEEYKSKERLDIHMLKYKIIFLYYNQITDLDKKALPKQVFSKYLKPPPKYKKVKSHQINC